MSLLSSIGSAISGAYNTVKNTVSNLFTSSPINLTAASSMAFPVGANMSPAQTATANKVIANGGTTPSFTNPYNITTGSSGGGMTSIYPGAAAPAPVSFAPGVKTGSGQNMTPLISGNSIFGGGSTGGYGASGDYSGTAYSGNALTTSSYPSFSAPSGASVSTDSIGSQPAAIGSSPSATNYTGQVVMNNTSVGANPTTGQFDQKGTTVGPDGKTVSSPTDQAQANEKTALDNYLANLQRPASEADAYNRAQQEAGLQAAQQQRLNTQNTINGITAKMNSDLLQLRGTAGKEGVTEAVYGGQQAEVTREATVQLLPLQAQLAADQGNLELAQKNTDTLFQIYAKDAQNSVDFYNTQVKAVYDLATTQQKREFDDLLWQKDQNAKTIAADAASQRDIAFELLKAGNTQGYKAITAIRPPVNMQSPTFAQEYQNYKDALASASSQFGGSFGIQGTVVNSNGHQLLINPRTGETIKDLGTAPLNAYSFAGTPAGNTLASAIANGQISPNQVNSRNASILANVLAVNPNFNVTQANAAANFFTNSGTQEKLAWSNSITTNLDLLTNLSAQVSRTQLPAINKAIIAGKSITGDVATVQFVNAANRTAAELAKVLGDSGGSDFRTRLANELLDPSYSPQQFAGAVATEKQMIKSLQDSFYTQGGQTVSQTSNDDQSLLDAGYTPAQIQQIKAAK